MSNKAYIYLRLSQDDKRVDNESNSISNQRILIQNFTKSNDIEIAGEYIDDGYSGINFNRPQFQQMIKDLSDSKVKIVIVKDLSRFGRDYIEMGRYIQHYFPRNGIRFIAILDAYDSFEIDTTKDHLFLPIKNFINDSYCRDISIKIRSFQKVKRNNGEYIGALVPFGYLRHPTNKYRFIKDMKVVPIIQQIFSLKIEGYSSKAIANILNDNEIVTPNQRRLDRDGISPGFKATNNKWDAKMVNRIITNHVYIGTIEQGKTSKLNYKSTVIIKVPKKDWICCENTHEPIVSHNIFELANKFHLCDLKQSGAKPDIFAGLLFCDECGQAMIKRNKRYKETIKEFYICGTYNQGNGCSRHSISKNKLLEILEKILFSQLKYREKLIEKIEKIENFSIPLLSNSLDLEKSRRKYQVLNQGLISDLEDEILTVEEFESLKRFYRNKIFQIENQIAKQNEIERQANILLTNRSEWEKLINPLKGELNRFSLVTSVDRIEIGSNREISVIFYHSEEIALIESLQNSEVSENE